MIPSLQEGQVIAVDPKTRKLTVQLTNTQVVTVRPTYHGPADAVRVNHAALPQRGTWGLVAFPYGDDRAGLWLNSFYPAFMDSLTTDTDPYMEYNSHWSGAYEFMDQTGQHLKSYPDGSFFLVSGSAVKPTMYRHTVDQNQVQQLTAFPDSERIPNPPSAFTVTLQHATGASVAFDVSGTITIKDPAGTATVVVAPGGTITAKDPSGTILELTNDGNVTITGNLKVSGNITAQGEVQGGSTDIKLTQHTHGGVQSGGSDTTAPNAGT